MVIIEYFIIKKEPGKVDIVGSVHDMPREYWCIPHLCITDCIENDKSKNVIISIYNTNKWKIESNCDTGMNGENVFSEHVKISSHYHICKVIETKTNIQRLMNISDTLDVILFNSFAEYDNEEKRKTIKDQPIKIDTTNSKVNSFVKTLNKINDINNKGGPGSRRQVREIIIKTLEEYKNLN